MYPRDFFYCLELNDHQIIHKHVDSKTYFQIDTVIDNWQLNFHSYVEPGLAEFMSKAHTISLLEQTRTKSRMHFQRGLDYFVAKLIGRHCLLSGFFRHPLCSFVPFVVEPFVRAKTLSAY